MRLEFVKTKQDSDAVPGQEDLVTYGLVPSWQCRLFRLVRGSGEDKPVNASQLSQNNVCLQGLLLLPGLRVRDNPEDTRCWTGRSEGLRLNGEVFLPHKSEAPPKILYQSISPLCETEMLGSLILSCLKDLKDKRNASISRGHFIETWRENLEV